MFNEPISIYFITVKESEPLKNNGYCMQKSFFALTNIFENAVFIGFQQAFAAKMNKPNIIKIEKMGTGFCDYDEMNDIFEYRRNHANNS